MIYFKTDATAEDKQYAPQTHKLHSIFGQVTDTFNETQHYGRCIFHSMPITLLIFLVKSLVAMDTNTYGDTASN